jgi:hypothetical protein
MIINLYYNFMVLIDKNLTYKRESNTASFTLLMYNLSKDDLIIELKHKLALISTIKNTFRKIKLNDRLYEYLITIEKSSIQSYSQIVLIGSERYIYKLDKKDIGMLEEYSIPKFTIQNDEYFNIHWLVDLFENFKFYDVIIDNSNKITHWQVNTNKKKIIKQNINTEYIKSLSVNWFMVGKLNPQNKTKYMVKHYPNNQNNMSWVEIIQQIELIEINKIIQELEKHLDNISSNSDKYVFGSDIYEIIESYNMKELYIHKNIRKQFDDTIIEKDLSSYINFNIIEINSSDSNSTNIANMFLKNYSGILGIKYY